MRYRGANQQPTDKIMTYAIDTHAIVSELEATGFERRQAECIVAAIVSAAAPQLTQSDLTVALADVVRTQDLERFATKADLERCATKADLERFATKSDLERFATKDELEAAIQKLSAKLMAMQATFFMSTVVVILGGIKLLL